MEFFIGRHVKVSRTGKAEQYGLFFPCFPAFDSFVNGYADGMGAFRGRKDSLHPCKVFRRLKHIRLLYAGGLHQPLVVKLRQGGTHAMVA